MRDVYANIQTKKLLLYRLYYRDKKNTFSQKVCLLQTWHYYKTVFKVTLLF